MKCFSPSSCEMSLDCCRLLVVTSLNFMSLRSHRIFKSFYTGNQKIPRFKPFGILVPGVPNTFSASKCCSCRTKPARHEPIDLHPLCFSSTNEPQHLSTSRLLKWSKHIHNQSKYPITETSNIPQSFRLQPGLRTPIGPPPSPTAELHAACSFSEKPGRKQTVYTIES